MKREKILKAIANETRLKILELLLLNSEMSVNIISKMMKMSQSSISQNLKVLNDAEVIEYYKDGKKVIYKVSNEHDILVRTILRLLDNNEI